MRNLDDGLEVPLFERVYFTHCGLEDIVRLEFCRLKKPYLKKHAG